jgi:ferric-dicitrate binding protein FerR (iron transport regulator)
MEEISVVHGKVSVQNNSGELVILDPGFAAINDKTTSYIKKYAIQDANFLAWKSKVLSFDNTELSEIIQTLTDYYGVRVVNRSEVSNACRFTGTFSDRPLTEVIETISVALNLQNHKEHDSYILTGEGCAQ